MFNIPKLKEKQKKFQEGEILTQQSFEFISQIGIGAFGKVYKVKSKKTSKLYALKVLSQKQLKALNLMEQLQNEIEILARCNHPGIIELETVFNDDAYIYMIMELATNGTLFHALKKNKKLNEETTANYMEQIINAIAYLHSMNPPILHRDIKPENILLSGNKLKLCDFGWSNLDKKDDIRNTFCGTPDYLSPEMILGTGHNEKLDVWTLGILMFELLQGKPPFSPSKKIKDKRLQQKIIEDNVLKGNINFTDSFSHEAKSAIKILLNPNANLRPYAKDILNLEFFTKYQKKNQVNIKNSDAGQQDKLTNQIIEMRNQMYLKDQQISEKDEIILRQEQEINRMKLQLMKKSQDTENQDKTIINDTDTLDSNQNKKLKQELQRQEETVAYLFKRTKHMSGIISDFYMNHVVKDSLNTTQEFVLSYDSTLKKLDSIFSEFKKLEKFKNNNNKPDPQQHHTYSPYSQINKTFNKANSVNINQNSNIRRTSQGFNLPLSNNGVGKPKPHFP